MNADMWQVLLIVATLVVAGYALYKSHQNDTQITPMLLAETVQEAIPVAKQLQEIAQLAVNSVEQLRRERKITDNNIAFRTAIERTKKWLPAEWQVDNEDIVAAVNGAILVASALSRQAGKSSEDGTSQRLTQ